MITYQEEGFSACINEARPLLEHHWQELAHNKERIILTPAFNIYRDAEQRNKLCIATVRNSGALIGYACYLVEKNLHYSDYTWAISDLFWLHPEYRGKGMGEALFRFIEGRLKLRSAAVMHTTYKIAHPAAGRMLEKLGHVPIEIGCSKTLIP